MPINYPVSVDTLPTNRQNRVRQPVDADDLNDIARYANAIGAELGANPSGSYTDVAARLAEFRKSVAGVVSDASFAATPTDGAYGVNTSENQFAYRSGGQWYGLTPPPVPDFAIVATVGTAYALDKRGAVVFKSSSRDSGAVLNSILQTSDAAATPGLRRGGGTVNAAGVVRFGPQNHDIKSVAKAPPVPNGSTADKRWLAIDGRGAVLTMSSTGSRFLDLGRTANDDSFQQIALLDLVIDGTAIDNTRPQHVIIGPDGGFTSPGATHVNISDIAIVGVKTRNVPRSASSIKTIALYSAHGGPGESLNTIKNILLRDLDFQGGNYGAFIAGTGGSTGVEVYHDNILIDNCHWDSLITPAVGGADAGWHIGSRGYGNRCVIRNSTAKGSVDVGFEIDGMTNSIVENCEGTDCYHGAFLYRNFHAAEDSFTQRNIWRNCRARYAGVVLDGTFACNSFQVFGTATEPFGHAILEDCQVQVASATLAGASASIFNIGVAQVRRLTISGLEATIAIADTSAGSTFNNPIQIRPNIDSIVNIERVKVRLTGSTTNASASIRCIYFSANASTKTTFRLSDILLDVNISGLGASRLTGMLIGGDTGTMHGIIDRLEVPQFGADTTPVAIVIGASTTLTIDGQILVRNCNFSGGPAGIVEVSVGDTTNKAKIQAIGDVWKTYPKPSAVMGATNFASAAWTTATPNQYIGLTPAEIHFANGTGAGVTKIEASKDGTTYEAVWDQASGAMAQDVLVSVDNGDFLRLTYATTAPTTRVRFRR